MFGPRMREYHTMPRNTIPFMLDLSPPECVRGSRRQPAGPRSGRRARNPMKPGVLEGLDEILTVTRLKLPTPLRRSLACTNAIENMMGTVRSVCRNVKRWRNAAMALR
jgi:hypothetical protein